MRPLALSLVALVVVLAGCAGLNLERADALAAEVVSLSAEEARESGIAHEILTQDASRFGCGLPPGTASRHHRVTLRSPQGSDLFDLIRDAWADNYGSRLEETGDDVPGFDFRGHSYKLDGAIGMSLVLASDGETIRVSASTGCYISPPTADL